MITSGRRTGRSRTGAAAVEFALCGGIFIMMFFGILELSRAMMVTHVLNLAATAGARVGACGSPTEKADTMATRVETQVTAELALGGITNLTSPTTVKVNGSTASAGHTMASGDVVLVTVTAPADKVGWFALHIASSVSFQGIATSIRE